MSRVVATIALALLVGCGASSRVIRGPDGTPWYEVECRHTSDCLEEAARLCPGGYEVGTSGSTLRGVYSTGYAVVPVTQHEFFLRCAPRPQATESTGGIAPSGPKTDPGF